jgi:hypothetical protein
MKTREIIFAVLSGKGSAFKVGSGFITKSCVRPLASYYHVFQPKRDQVVDCLYTKRTRIVAEIGLLALRNNNNNKALRKSNSPRDFSSGNETFIKTIDLFGFNFQSYQ